MPNSMQTPVWGPLAWAYLHLWSLSFPEKPTPKERLAFATTFLSFVATLPCNICVDNVPGNLVAIGFAKPHTPQRLARSAFLTNRGSFTRMLFDLHNQVSKMLGKDTSHLDYNRVMEDLELARAKACKTSQDQHGGCTQPKYKACQTKIYIIDRFDAQHATLEGGQRSSNLNLDVSSP